MTVILLLFYYVKLNQISGLLTAGAMGLFHGVEHYEKLKVTDSSSVELFMSTWSDQLKEATTIRYDWSYIVAWVGVGMCLGSSILFSMSALCITVHYSTNQGASSLNMN